MHRQQILTAEIRDRITKVLQNSAEKRSATEFCVVSINAPETIARKIKNESPVLFAKD